MTWQALAASLGAGAFGAAQQRSFQKRMRKIGRQNEREIVGLQGENTLLGQQTLADIDAARSTIAGGFRSARASTRGAFNRADRGVRLQGKADQARSESALLQSGRANTGLLNLARQGVSYSTAMQLQEIARSLSGALAPLDIGAAEADAGLQLGKAGARAQTFGNRVGLQRSIHASRLGQVAEPIDASAGFGALADLLDQIFSPSTKPSTQVSAAPASSSSFDLGRDDSPVGGVA